MRPLAIATAFALLALSATAPAVAQQYYKWKDANGVTHYTTGEGVFNIQNQGYFKIPRF